MSRKRKSKIQRAVELIEKSKDETGKPAMSQAEAARKVKLKSPNNLTRYYKNKAKQDGAQ